MVRGSFGMVGLVMMAKVRMVFYWVMVWVMVGLVVGVMVDMTMTVIR